MLELAVAARLATHRAPAKRHHTPPHDDTPAVALLPTTPVPTIDWQIAMRCANRWLVAIHGIQHGESLGMAMV